MTSRTGEAPGSERATLPPQKEVTLALAYEMGWAASRSFWMRRMAGDSPSLPENPFMEEKT